MNHAIVTLCFAFPVLAGWVQAETPTLTDFQTPAIPIDGLDAPAVTNHWLWAQADGRFGKGILNMEDVRAGAGGMLDGTVVVKINAAEAVSSRAADWKPNEVVRRCELHGLKLTGEVRAAERKYALLSRLLIENPAGNDATINVTFSFAMHTPLAKVVEPGHTTRNASTHLVRFDQLTVPAGNAKSFRVVHLFRGDEQTLDRIVAQFDTQWIASDQYWNAVLEDAFDPAPGPFFSGGVPNLRFDDPALTRLYRFGVVSALMCLKNDPDRRTPCNWYGTSMPDAIYGTESYIWDVGYASAVLAQLDPVALRNVIEHWAAAGVHQRMCVPYHRGPSICGPRFYAASGSLFTYSVQNYLEATHDYDWLKKSVAGKTIWQHLLAVNRWHDDRPQWNGLAHYGDERNLFDDDTVPGYQHWVAAPNAAAVWIKRTIATIADQHLGDEIMAAKLRREADALARAVIENLYSERGEFSGTWKQRHADGRVINLRHGWDFMNAGAFLAGDLRAHQRKQMRDWFVGNLMCPQADAIWMVTQDRRDGNNGPHQMEHNGGGAYPAWPFHAAWALRELGFPEDASKLTKQIAPVVRYGAISQGNSLDGRRCRSGWCSVAGASIATMVQENFEAKR